MGIYGERSLMRIQKFIAHAGICSRRAAERLVAQGRVRVNGLLVTRPGIEVDPQRDQITVDGRPVELAEDHVYVVLHKPPGVVTTVRDPQGRPTVMGLLKGLRRRVYPVGRLDLDSEGLLLLTDDGELANRLIHPRYKVEKRYRVTVKGHPKEQILARVSKGITLDGRPTLPCTVREIKRSRRSTTLEVVLREGRKRQIRRMFEAVGHPVRRLVRVAVGPIELRGLAPGRWRHLAPEEVALIRRAVGLPGRETAKGC